MGRRRWNKKHPDKARAQQPARRPEDTGDPPVRLLSLQPSSTIVGVAMGNRVAFVNYKTGEEVRLQAPTAATATTAAASAAPTTTASSINSTGGFPHTGHLRVLQFSPDGRFLLTGADDKAARLWAPASSSSPSSSFDAASAAPAAAWRCVASWRTPKKTSAGGFSLDGAYALFADKFGDVLIGRVPASELAKECEEDGKGWEGSAAATAPASAQAGPLPQVPGTLLGHFCTIVTGLAPSPCGNFLATGDREYKVRISVLSRDLLQGSYEIQGYCLGHQDFVSCIAFAVQQRAAASPADAKARPGVLLSGSGDGTVRVWDYEKCTQLSLYVASAPADPAEMMTAAEAVGGAAAADASAAAADGTSAQEEASGGGDEGDDEGDGEGEAAALVGGGDEGDGPSEAGQGDGDGEGGGGGGGGGSGFEEPRRRSKAPPCAPVLSLAVAPDGCTVAVVVEGDEEVQLLQLNWATRSLSMTQRLRWPDVRYPCQAAFGPTGQLWVVGGAPLPMSTSVHVGVAQQSPDGQFVVCTEEVLPAAARALLEARVEEEEAKLADEGGELFAYSKRLRKPKYDEEEVQKFKRKRNDFKETQRLAALRLRQDEQAKQQQQGKQNGVGRAMDAAAP